MLEPGTKSRLTGPGKNIMFNLSNLGLVGDVIPRDSLTIPLEEREGSDPDGCVRKSSRCFNECLLTN